METVLGRVGAGEKEEKWNEATSQNSGLTRLLLCGCEVLRDAE